MEYKIWYNFLEVIKMMLKWKAFVERYIYDSREEQRKHKKEMSKRGYTDSGLSSVVLEDDGECHRTYCGEYRKYIKK